MFGSGWAGSAQTQEDWMMERGGIDPHDLWQIATTGRMGICSRTWTFPANEIGATGLRRPSVLMMMMMMIRGVARGGHGWMSPRHGLKKILAPEFQTDDCFATGVTRQTLLIPKENVQFQRWFFRKLLGGYGAPPQTPHPRRFAPSRLARDLRSLHRRALLMKMLATRLMMMMYIVYCMQWRGRSMIVLRSMYEKRWRRCLFIRR